MRRFYIKLIVALQLLIAAGVLAVYLLSRTETTELVGEKLLKPQGITYSKLEGTVYEGLTLHDVNLSEGVFAEELAVRYRLSRLLLGTPLIDEITLKGLRVEQSELGGGEAGGAQWGIPPFEVEKLVLEKGRFIGDENLTFSLRAKAIAFDGEALDVPHLKGTLQSRWGDLNLSAAIAQNVLSGDARLRPAQRLFSLYAPYVVSPPQQFAIRIEEATTEGVTLNTTLSALTPAADANTTVGPVQVGADYRYGEEHIDLQLGYRLCRGAECATFKQGVHLFFDGSLRGCLEAGEFETPLTLPFESVHADYTLNEKGLRLSATAGALALGLQSEDFDAFGFTIKSEALALGALGVETGSLASAQLRVDASGYYILSEAVLGGSLEAASQGVGLSGSFVYAESALLSELQLSRAGEGEFADQLESLRLLPLQLTAARSGEDAALHLTAEPAEVTLVKKAQTLQGWGEILGAQLQAQGTVPSSREVEVNVKTQIPSLFSLADTFTPQQLESYEFYDAGLELDAQLRYDGNFTTRGKVGIPWYALVFDTKSRFYGNDSYLEFTQRGSALTLEQYRLDVMNRALYANRPSQLHVDENLTLHLDALWVLDALRVTGTASAQGAQLRLHGNDVVYDGAEGKVRFDADVQVNADAAGSQQIEGSVLLKEGLITYVPVKDMVVEDDDIIIIQEVRAPSQLRRSMNVHIGASKPLRYKTKQVELQLLPDVTLWQEEGEELGLLGMVSLDDGLVSAGGKEFTLQPSHLYFGGSNPINPYLDLYADYEYDMMLFHIYITHTLESPVFLFSSEPAMGENDIMSYILFGMPANEMFGGTGGGQNIAATNLLFGTGLKELIGDTTGVQVDTLNLISNPEGELGFEVGARIDRNLRVVYRNDTISNLMLQYRLNRWLRLDVEVYDTGQGVNLIYIKDFEAFERD